jgi:formylglycine-generating enzyme required for sulfatase activity
MTGCKQKPAADFDALVVSGTAPLAVQFTDLSTSGGSPITAWHWLFGDGAESTLQAPAHTYSTAGTYNVSLEVTSSKGSDTELKLAYIHVAAPVAGTIQTVMLPGNVPMELVWIPGGAFMMGRYAGEQDSFAWEDPQHSVTLGGFWMATHELTKRQWTAVMGTTPWSGQLFVLADLDSPAVYVSWDDAKSFLTALNNYTGQTFRLPAEAEWEYACRAGETTRYYWGDDPGYTDIGNFSWYLGNCSSELYAHVVGGKTANGFGLYDMSGNVSEWCEDDAHNDYIGAPTGGQAWVDTPRGIVREVRGGAWNGPSYGCRSADRSSGPPNLGFSSLGFRIVQAS